MRNFSTKLGAALLVLILSNPPFIALAQTNENSAAQSNKPPVVACSQSPGRTTQKMTYILGDSTLKGADKERIVKEVGSSGLIIPKGVTETARQMQNTNATPMACSNGGISMGASGESQRCRTRPISSNPTADPAAAIVSDWKTITA